MKKKEKKERIYTKELIKKKVNNVDSRVATLLVGYMLDGKNQKKGATLKN